MTTLADINSQIKKHDEQIAQLRMQAEQLRNQERSGVIEEIRKKIAEYGITASDLKLTSRAPGRRAASAASSGAWKSESPMATTSSSMRFKPKNARLPPRAFSVKNARNASRPSVAISSFALNT